MSFDYFVTLNGQQLLVNPHAITPRHSIELNEKITEARIKVHLNNKIPPNPDEKREDWLKRCNEELKKDSEQKKEELATDFIKRAIGDHGFKDNQDYMYDCLLAIAQVFNQESKISREGFNNSSILQINNFIARVCKKAKVPVEFVVDVDEESTLL